MLSRLYCLIFTVTCVTWVVAREFTFQKTRSLFKSRFKRDVENAEDMFTEFHSEDFKWVDIITTNDDKSYYNYTGYNSWLPIRDELYRLAKTYDFVTVEQYGKTHENRELLALHINKAKKNEVVFLNSLMHAREWMTGCITMNIIHRLLEYSTEDAKFLLANFHFVIIPVVNPDGYEYTHTTNRMWRKNREPTTEKSCKGVDVNRNFMYGYKAFKGKESKEERGPCTEIYPGDKALSSKEATGLNMLLFKYRQRMRYYIDYHSFGNIWLNAYGAHNWLPKNDLQLGRYRKKLMQTMTAVLGHHDWTGGNVFDVLYQCFGIVVDHVHYYVTPLAFTVEVGDERDEFNPPDTRINTYVISQWLALISQLRLLKSEMDSGQYAKDRTLNWRRTNMQKRTVVYKRGDKDSDDKR